MKLYNIGKTKLIDFNLTGNIIPPSWYQHIKRENGKPYSIAIELLGDICFWYRPIEVRDEKTGVPEGHKKKFRADKLQRAYGAFADYYGYSKNQVRDALRHLEEMKLIDLDFRNIIVAGTEINNVLYIGLNVAKVKSITYTLSQKKQTGARKNQIAPPKESDTNTEDHPNNHPKDHTEEKNGAKPTPRKRDILLDHPAIKAHKDIIRLNVPIIFRQTVVDTVGDSPASLNKWKQVLRDWIGSGYNPRGIKNILDKFQGGKPKKENPEDGWKKYVEGEYSDFIEH